MAKTLLTGATGFLGEFILQALLATGREVRTLVRNPEGRALPWRNLVEVVAGDITDLISIEQAMEDVDEVVHAAAMVSFRKQDHALIKRINVQGTANLVNVALAHEVSRMVHVSSIAAIGESLSGHTVDEQSPWNPKQAKSMYAKSKYESELEVYRGIAEGLHAVMVNPGLILGPTAHWDDGTGQMFKLIHNGLRFTTHGTNAIVGAKDVAAACVRLLDTDVAPGERYILAADNWSYLKLFGTIAQAMNKPANHIAISKTVALLAGWVSERVASLTGAAPGLTVESMRSSGSRWEYDGSKITQLGFEYTPIEKVIQETASAYLATIRPS